MSHSATPVRLLIASGSPELQAQMRRALARLRVSNPVTWIETVPVTVAALWESIADRARFGFALVRSSEETVG